MSYPDLCIDREHFHAIIEPPQLRWALLRIGSEVIPERFNGNDPGHSWWSLYLPERADMALERDGLPTFPLSLQHVTFIPPWMPFRYRFGRDMGHAYIHFSVENLPGALTRRLLPDPIYLEDRGLCQDMRRLAVDLGHERVTDPCLLSLRASEIVGRAMPLIVESLDPADRNLLFTPDGNWGRLSPALRFVRRNLHERLSVADLAAVLDVGEKQCTRLFRRHLGQSPVQYITEQRLQRVGELLLSTDWPLEEIAHYCGYPNAQYLSRIFRRQHGMPPGTWRMRYGNA